MLGLLHGLRISEVAGLTWGCIDFREGVAHVRRGLSENARTGERVLTELKNTASARSVPLSQMALSALRRRRAKLPGPPHLERLVFTNMKGGAIRRSNFHRRVWRPILRRADLPALRFHDLRHCAASTLLAAGNDLPTVSGMLGHSSPAVTMRVYAHALPSGQREAAQRVDDLFGS